MPFAPQSKELKSILKCYSQVIWIDFFVAKLTRLISNLDSEDESLFSWYIFRQFQIVGLKIFFNIFVQIP